MSSFPYVDLRAIEQVLYSYCAGVDRKDWDLVASCYHPDARDEHGTVSGTVNEFLEWLAERHNRVVQSFHALANVRLVDHRPGAAVTESMCLVRQTLRRRDESLLRISLGCRYIDLFRRTSDRWLIAHRSVTYDWIEEVARGSDMLEGTSLTVTDRSNASIDEVRHLLDVR